MSQCTRNEKRHREYEDKSKPAVGKTCLSYFRDGLLQWLPSVLYPKIYSSYRDFVSVPTLGQLKFILLSFRICSSLQIIPVKIQKIKTLEYVHVQVVSNNSFIHKTWIIFSLVLSANLGFRLREYSFNPWGMLHYFPLHWICFLGGVSSTFWSLRLFIQHGDLSSKVFTEILGRIPNHRNHQCKWTHTVESSAGGISPIQKLALLTLPCSFLFSSFLFTLCYIYTPESPQFLFSLIQEFIGNGMPFFCAICEYWIFIFWVFTYNYGLAIVILFLMTWEIELRQGIEAVRKRRTLVDPERYCSKLKIVALQVQLFNLVFRPLTLLLEVTTLTISITGFFFFLQLTGGPNWLPGAVSGCLAVISFIAFAVVYNRAFHIPELIKSFKSEIMMGSRRSSLDECDKRLSSRILASVKDASIEVGEMYKMQRVYILSYVAFCVTGVCNLAVTFRGSFQYRNIY